MTKCDHCNNEATVHEVTVRHGMRVDRHLCEQCAMAQGLVGGPSGPNLAELLSSYMIPQGSGLIVGPDSTPIKAGKGAPKTLMCGSCKTTFNQFKDQGLLGCPACYKAFEAQLSALLERVHEGSAQHAGKVPKRLAKLAMGDSAEKLAALSALEERAQRLKTLRRQLDEAVKGEQYERAAKLRDELRTLDVPPTAGKATEPDRRTPPAGPN